MGTALIKVLYLFQFLFNTREHWRGKRDKKILHCEVAYRSVCKNKILPMKFIHKFLCIYLILFTSIIFQSRAKTATELLNELNDDVNGCYEDEVCIFFKKFVAFLLVILIF